MTIGLRSAAGHFRRTAVVGLAVFTQYWYWYPLSHFLSLAFQPTAIVGVNADLKMPQMQLVSNCKPSIFAYAAPLTQEAAQQVHLLLHPRNTFPAVLQSWPDSGGCRLEHRVAMLRHQGWCCVDHS